MTKHTCIHTYSVKKKVSFGIDHIKKNKNKKTKTYLLTNGFKVMKNDHFRKAELDFKNIKLLIFGHTACHTIPAESSVTEYLPFLFRATY